MAGLPTFQFDTSIIKAVDHNRVSWGPTVYACNVNIHDGMQGLSFETWGDHYYYIVTAWSNRVEIKVYDLGAIVHLSTMIPRNQDELVQTLDTIAADFEEWLHKRHAA